MKTFAVTVRIRNNLLLQRRQEAGLSQEAVAEASGISKQVYAGLEKLTASPWVVIRPTRCVAEGCRRRGVPRLSWSCVEHGADDETRKVRYRNWRATATVTWSSAALAIAAYHGVTPSDLWPDAVSRISEAVVTRTMDADDLDRLCGSSPSAEDRMIESETAGRVATVLATLSAREQDILARRFGLNGREAQIAARVADDLGISRERLRQIEARAVRKLRHPSRARAIIGEEIAR